MSGTLRLKGSTSGYSELKAPAVAGDQTFILPAVGGDLLTTDNPAPYLTLESGVVTAPSLRFEGDLDTGLYTPAANKIGIVTNANERVSIDSNGNVGIGTSSPTAKLHAVVGTDWDSASYSFVFENQETQNLYGNSVRIIGGGGAGAGDSNSNTLAVGDNDGNIDFVVRGDGNVGIGTSNPTGKLEIAGNNSSQIIQYGDGTTAGYFISRTDVNRGTADAGLHIHDFRWNGTSVAKIKALTGDDTVNKDNGYLTFDTSNGAGVTERMRIASDGNVGIGTTSPAQELEVAGSAPRIRITDNNTTAASGSNSYLEFYGSDARAGVIYTDATGLNVRADNTGGNNVAFWTGTSEKMRLNSSGNVGIGTSSPTGPLHVQNNDNSPGGTIQVWGADTGANLRNVSLLAPETDNSSAPFTFFTNNSWNFRVDSIDALTIDSSGNVGIGTSAPGALLEVVSSSPTVMKVRRTTAANATIEFMNSNADTIFAGSSSSNDFCVHSSNNLDSNPHFRIDRNTGQMLMGAVAGTTTAIDHSILCEGRLVTEASYTFTTGSAANMFINSNGLVIRSTSSARYKTNIETLEDSYADKLLECRPVWYRSTATDDTNHPEWSYYGFIAEEVADVDPRLVHYDEQEDGTLQPEGVQYTQMIAHLVNIVKRQKQQLVDFETRLSALETAN